MLSLSTLFEYSWTDLLCGYPICGKFVLLKIFNKAGKERGNQNAWRQSTLAAKEHVA
jgi:hypothetical protein